MTEEQYNEVISLDKRLNELKGVYLMQSIRTKAYEGNVL